MPASSRRRWLLRVAGVLAVVCLAGGPGYAQLIPSRLVWSPMGGSNVWNGSNTNWVNQQTGLRQSWTPNAIAIFPGSGAYAVTLAEGVFVGGFEVADGAQVTVTGSTITLLGPPSLNPLLSGGPLRINSGLNVFSQMTASGTLTLGGDARVSTINLSSAGSSQLRVAGDLRPSTPGARTSIAGDEGGNTVAVESGGVLFGAGGLGGGADTLSVAGTLDLGSSGVFSLGGGGDTFIVLDGMQLIGVVDGDAGGDTISANVTGAVTLSAGQIRSFENLSKSGTGALTLAGGHVYSGGVTLAAGVLNAPGGLETPSFTASGGTFGDGDDFLTVGTLNTGAGVLSLGGGADVLRLSGGVTGAVDGGAGGDTVQIDTGNALTLAEGQARNFENLAKSGTGALTLTGSHGYSGGTTVSGGTLAVGGVLETPAVSLGGGTRLELSGTLRAAGGGAAAVTGSAGVETISGGPGSVLRAAGTLGGGADVVTAGTLDTGAGALDLGAGADVLRFYEQVSGVVDGGAGTDALEADVAGAAALSGASVRGFEILRKLNGGTLALVGDHGYSEGAAVTGGGLNVGGRLTAAVSVASGARLNGAGVVAGNVAVAPGGTLAPGDSIGTLTVAGSLELFGTLEIEASPASADQVIVAGGVNIAGAGLAVQELAPVGWPANAEFTIIDNRGAAPVNGTFGTVAHTLAFLDPTVSYRGGDGNDVVLTLTRNRVDLESVGETANQRAVLGALESMDPAEDRAALNAVLVLGEAEARTAADALSGEAHAAAKGMLFSESRHVREAITGRIRQSLVEATEGAGLARFLAGGPAAQLDAPLPGGAAIWIEGIASRGEVEADGNAAATRRSIGGALFGVDVVLAERWRVGMAGGYGRSSGLAAARGSESSLGGFHLASYAGVREGSVGVRFGAAFGWHQVESVREAAFPGFRETLRVEYGGRTAQVFGEAGYTIERGRLAVEPFGGVTVGFLETDPFAETGGTAALAAAGQSQRLILAAAGGRVAADLGGDGPVRWVPRGSVAWQRAAGDVAPETVLAFEGSRAFTVTGATVGRSLALIEGGVDARLSGALTFGGGYSGQFGGGVRDHGVRFQVSFGL